MKGLATLGFLCMLVLGLAGCGRKTPLTLPPPQAEHPAATAAAPAPTPGSQDHVATGSNTQP